MGLIFVWIQLAVCLGLCVVCFVVYFQYIFEIISLHIYIYNISTYMHAHIILFSFCVGLHGNSIRVVKNDHSMCFPPLSGRFPRHGAVP